MGMKVDQREVEHVAMLARIELTEEEKDLYSEQLSTILEFFDRLKEVDTEGVPPTSHVVDLVNVYRPDQVRPGLGVEAVLRNAPDRANRFFRVPKILD
jgi:aspartyl-tRNA(Asn)/glutamyl-tRNA(Gln) amidotransferase subunit C